MEKFWTNLHSLVGGNFSPTSSPSSSPSHSASPRAEDPVIAKNNNDSTVAVGSTITLPAATGSNDVISADAPSSSEATSSTSECDGVVEIAADASSLLNAKTSAPETGGGCVSKSSDAEKTEITTMDPSEKDVETMNEQNLARSRSPKPGQPDAIGWDLRGQLLGAGSKVLSPISTSSRFVKNLFWGAATQESDAYINGPEAVPTSSAPSSQHPSAEDPLAFAPCFGVNIPPESRTAEAQPGVYYNKDEILKMIKKCQGARFKSFNTFAEADFFSQMAEEDLLNSSLLIKTPSKPKNPVFIDSPPPPPKLQPQPPSPLQLQHHQQQLLQLQLQQLNPPALTAAQGERLALKAPKTQDLMAMRRFITAGNIEAIQSLVWSNPRYLISSGDTPTIVQEGFHYTAMHVAARHGKHQIVEMLIETLSEIRLMKILYGEEPDHVVKNRQTFLLDLYLNLPDKGANDTPLHLACKFGHIDVIRVLLRHPLTSRNEINKFKETPAEVVCSRCPRGEDEADSYRLEILRMFEKVFIVPILRHESGLGAPKVGYPTHFTTGKDASVQLHSSSSAKSPLFDDGTENASSAVNARMNGITNENNRENTNYVISAYAGPMMEKEANAFRLRLCRRRRPPNQSTPQRRPGVLRQSTPSQRQYTPQRLFDLVDKNLTSKNFESSSSTDIIRNSSKDALDKSSVAGSSLEQTSATGERFPSPTSSGETASSTATRTKAVSEIATSSSPPPRRQPIDTFVTPLKVTPPWLAGGIGSGDSLECTPGGSLLRFTDSEKGLEHEGRLLAAEMKLEWKESWEFLENDDLIDVSQPQGLRKLDQFFQTRYEEVEEREADVSEVPLEDSFTDNEDDSLGDLVSTFRSKLVIMSPTKEDCGSFDQQVIDGSVDGNVPEVGALTTQLSDSRFATEDAISERAAGQTLPTSLTSPSTLKELCRRANPFDTMGVGVANSVGNQNSNETYVGKASGDVDSSGTLLNKTSARIASASVVPFETQIYVKGSLPSHMDTELLHALRLATVDLALYPHLAKWLHLLNSRYSEEERQRWPTTPRAASKTTVSKTLVSRAASGSVLTAASMTPPRGVGATQSDARRMIFDDAEADDGASSPKANGLRPTTLSFEFSPTEVKRMSRIDKANQQQQQQLRQQRQIFYDDNGNLGHGDASR